jgi:hypothetical protein
LSIILSRDHHCTQDEKALTEHSRTCTGDIDQFLSDEACKHARYQPGQQVYAYGRHRVQLEEDVEIQVKESDDCRATASRGNRSGVHFLIFIAL